MTGAATTSAFDPQHAPGRLEHDEAARAHAADLYGRHGRMVEGLCRGLLRDRSESEDASQQTFLSAYRALLAGTEPREPAAWLATIARNECLARIRARMREPLPVEALEAESKAPDPLTEALRRADLTAFWAGVSALPRPQREALLLREFGGLSYEELAVALGVSRPAVESLLFRARTRLREQLQTAVASLGGAGWISAAQDALARLLSAGGAAKIGSVPLVAKAVTATVGIAVVAGGAVVGEHRASPRPRAQHVSVAPVQRSSRVIAAPVVAAAAVRTAAAVALPVGGSSGHQFEPADTASTRADGHDGESDHPRTQAENRQPAESNDGERRVTAARTRQSPGEGDVQQSEGSGGSVPDQGSGSDGQGGGDRVSAIVTPVAENAPQDAALAPAAD